MSQNSSLNRHRRSSKFSSRDTRAHHAAEGESLSSKMKGFAKPLIELQQQREELALQIKKAKAKLQFAASSEPMREYVLDLLKKDLQMSLQLSQQLMSHP